MPERDYHSEIADRLLILEQHMRDAGLWSDTPPAPEAFRSTVPFFADRMHLGEWLQFVFIVRIRALIEADAPLPGPCAIHPIAEEWLKSMERQHDALLEVIGEIDALISHGAAQASPRH
ncbi:MAG: YqcC family protein [Gammaproteobacteria bacterium]|nr:MAG: YqcC family protein [Gammaproteobacteria bacterium]